MLNIASLDPAITSTGRAGLGNASALDRSIWDEFHEDWKRLAVECQFFSGKTRQVLSFQRIKQHFFRRSVISSCGGGGAACFRGAETKPTD